jgi:integrase
LANLPVATERQARLDHFDRPEAEPFDGPRPGIAASEPGPRTETGAAPAWNREVEGFLAHKAAEEPVGENWLRRMRWELTRVPNLLGRVEGLTPPRQAAELSAEHLRALRKVVVWEKATFALHFAALRQFLRWTGNPVAQVRSVWRLPSGQPSHRRWLTKPQLEQLLRSSRGPARRLVALEGVNGLRRIEVLRLRHKDVLLDEGCLRVLGKGRDGGKWRKIPMHPIVRELLSRLPQDGPAEDRLFPLSSSGADRLLRRATVRAGLTDQGVKVSHHDLRRTFGRLAHQSGMDLVQLKNLFGHSSVEMTVHYIGLDADRMRQGLDRIGLVLGTPGGGAKRATPGRGTGGKGLAAGATG